MSNSTPSKHCSKCNTLYPATTQFFAKQKRGYYGLTAWCKACWRTIRKQDRIRRDMENFDFVAASKIAEGLKQCSQCNQWKPANTEHFYTDKRIASGLHSWCRECRNEMQKTDPQRAIRRRKHYQKNRDHELENNRRYHETHKKEIRARHAEYRKTAAFKQSKRKHRLKPGVYKKELHRRKVNYSKNNQMVDLDTDVISHEQWQRALGYFYGCCAVCGRQMNDLFGDLVAASDHWVPLSKGGKSDVTNIVPLCHGKSGCNNSKKDKMPNRWLGGRYGKKKASEIRQCIEDYFAWAIEQE